MIAGVDPWFSRLVFTNDMSLVSATIHLPFFFTACILIMFYWYEMMSDSLQATSFLSIYKYPAYITIGALYVVEIVTQLLRALIGGRVPSYISSIFYGIVALVVSVCYLVTAGLLTRRIAQVSKDEKQTHKLILCTVACGVCFILMIINNVLILFPIYVSPHGFFFIGTTTYLWPTAISLVQTWAFRPPNQRKRSSARTGMRSLTGSMADSKNHGRHNRVL